MRDPREVCDRITLELERRIDAAIDAACVSGVWPVTMQVKQAGGAIGAMLDAYRLSGWQIEFRREGTHDTDGWFVIERPWVDWPKNIPPIKRAQQALAQAASAWFHDPKTAARLTGMDEIERGLWYAARDIAESQP